MRAVEDEPLEDDLAEPVGEGLDGPGTIVEMTYTVEPNYAGWRLDKYLCEKIRRMSRTRVQRVIDRDLVFERKLKPSTTVWPGLTFKLRRRVLPEPTVPDPSAIGQVHLDDWLLIVDKPAGLPIHPTARYHHGTLVEQLPLRFGAGFEAHPAHRLDRETSGLLALGRTSKANQRLFGAFARSEVHKEYLAIVEGAPPDSFEVDAPIAEGTELIRIAVRIDQATGKPSQTRFVVQARFRRDGADFALVRCVPLTGRQHQIRIHAALQGYPLVGDKMYGPDPGFFDRFTKRTLEAAAWARLRLPRHALHAASLSLPHPGTRERMTFEAPLPEDLQAFVRGDPAPAMP